MVSYNEQLRKIQRKLMDKFLLYYTTLKRKDKNEAFSNPAIFTGKYICRSLFLIKLKALPATSLKRDSKIFKNRFFIEYLWWLLLDSGFFRTETEVQKK